VTVSAESLLELVKKTIQAFKPSHLSRPTNGPENQQSRPLENLYSKEFYRAFLEVYGSALLLCPEWSTAGVRDGGSIDFVLPTKGWAIELTREAGKSKEQYCRFQSGGDYSKWIDNGTLNDFITIDFRTSTPQALSHGTCCTSKTSHLLHLTLL